MQSRVWRLAFAVVLIVAVLLCAVPMGVAAVKPYREELVFDDFTYGEDDCGFTLQWHKTAQNQYLKWFFDAQGNFLKLMLTGSLRGTITRVDTGKSIKANISEVLTWTYDQDGFLILEQRGQSWNDFHGNPPGGLPSVALYDGHWVFKLDPVTEEVIEVLSSHGHLVDLCAYFAE
jgi:hypothetical protein